MMIPVYVTLYSSTESNKDSSPGRMKTTMIRETMKRRAVYTFIQRLTRESSKKMMILIIYVQLKLKLLPLY